MVNINEVRLYPGQKYECLLAAVQDHTQSPWENTQTILVLQIKWKNFQFTVEFTSGWLCTVAPGDQTHKRNDTWCIFILKVVYRVDLGLFLLQGSLMAHLHPAHQPWTLLQLHLYLIFSLPIAWQSLNYFAQPLHYSFSKLVNAHILRLKETANEYCKNTPQVPYLLFHGLCLRSTLSL